MDQSMYVSKMEEKLACYFDIKKDVKVLEEEYALYATYHMMLGRTFLGKDRIIDRFETNEHIMMECIEKLDNELLEKKLESYPALLDYLVKTHSEHRSTYLSVVLVCNHISQDIDKTKIKKFKCDQIYCFYLQGFSEVRVIIVDLEKQLLLTNRAGKHVKKAYKLF